MRYVVAAALIILLTIMLLPVMKLTGKWLSAYWKEQDSDKAGPKDQG